MPTARECVCCLKISKVVDVKNETDNIQYITDHPGFHPVCLDEYVLRVAYYQYRQQYGNRPEQENEYVQNVDYNIAFYSPLSVHRFFYFCFSLCFNCTCTEVTLIVKITIYMYSNELLPIARVSFCHDFASAGPSVCHELFIQKSFLKPLPIRINIGISSSWIHVTMM